MRRIIGSAMLVLLAAGPAWAMTPEERKQYQDNLNKILLPVPAFTQWQQKTNELPPDFDALPKVNGLPDPFTFFDGKRKVVTPADWKDRRAEIIQLFQKYILGTIPPKPTLDQIIPVDAATAAADAVAGRGRGGPGGRPGRGGSATAPADGVAGAPTTGPAGGLAFRGATTGPAGRGARGPGGGLGARGGGGAAEGSVTKIVDLKYGPGSQITQRVTVVIPPGAGPFPVLMGGGANITSRGYISCSAPSNVDNPPDIGKYYPDYTWGSMAKCAWTTQMVVDYLYTLPEVDKRYIAITGYSRGGKYATISAALDERITACIAGSTGVGGVVTWRHGSEKNVGESIESTTRMFPIWFTPSIRFFSGREDRLPVDGNLLVDLIAPRSIFMLYGLNDEVSNTWGNEQTYYDSLKLFTFLGAADHISIDRPFGHHGANDAAGTNKWLDIQFGKSTDKWVNDFMFPWDYEKWKQASGAKVDTSKIPQPITMEGDLGAQNVWSRKTDLILNTVRWVLGDVPTESELAKNPVTNPGDKLTETTVIDDTPRWVIGRSIIEHGWTRQQATGVATRDIRFGPGKIRGDFYYKQNTPEGTKLPAVIFLHGYSYPLGYMWVYRMDPHPIIALANAGYAVLAYDQTGFGSRMNEAAPFYERYPQWSQVGRMVEDAKAAVDAAKKDPLVDPSKIYLFGYGMGGMVALHTAALDLTVKGVVSVCGFTPMRTNTPDKNTGGIAQFYKERGLIPRLGHFAGKEAQIPYDYPELIATIAPRPVYILSPLYDRDATPADVHSAVDGAKKAFELYGAANKLVLDEPWDYFRLSLDEQDRIVKWMGENMR